MKANIFSIKECQDNWADKKSKSKQKRFFKSEVEKREAAEAAGDAEEGDADEDEEAEEEAVDVWEMLPESKILPALSAKQNYDTDEVGLALFSVALVLAIFYQII